MNWIERKKYQYSKRRFGGNYQAVLDRDNNTCQLCNSKENIIVHHKIDINHNELENLICLCYKCHAIIHSSLKNLQEGKKKKQEKKEKMIKRKEDFILKQLNRAKEIIALRNNGLTLQEIANKYSLSRERIRQILNKYIV